jgi:prepilin-type N-terminal cleavage/methylation domain-containing protein
MFSRKGFTILELLIVIAVMAILIGIALPRFKGMQDEGNIAKAKGELRTIQTAAESYYVHAGVMPAIGDLTTAIPNIVGTTLPKDPFVAGGATDYTLTTNGSYLVAFSKGPGAGGTVTIGTTGAVTAASNMVYVTNGTPDVAHPSL